MSDGMNKELSAEEICAVLNEHLYLLRRWIPRNGDEIEYDPISRTTYGAVRSLATASSGGIVPHVNFDLIGARIIAAHLSEQQPSPISGETGKLIEEARVVAKDMMKTRAGSSEMRIGSFVARLADTLEASDKRFRDYFQDVEEREAACCPEDVGFDEYIGVLSVKLEAANSRADEAMERSYEEARQVSVEQTALTNRVAELEAALKASERQVAEAERWAIRHLIDTTTYQCTRCGLQIDEELHRKWLSGKYFPSHCGGESARRVAELEADLADTRAESTARLGRAQDAEDAIKSAAQHGDRMPELEAHLTRIRAERDHLAAELEVCKQERQRLRQLGDEFIWGEDDPYRYESEMTKLRGDLAACREREAALLGALQYPRYGDTGQLLLKAATLLDKVCSEGWQSLFTPHLRRAAADIQLVIRARSESKKTTA